MPLYGGSSGGGGSAITVKDEGVALTTAAASLDFAGAGVTASGTTDAKTITIPGGSNQLASIAAASAAIANTETVVASASLAANYLTAGMSFRIRAAGVGTTGLTPGADTFRVRIGTTTLTGNIPTSVAPSANASVTAQAFSFEALLTVRTTGATGSIIGECLVVGDDIATGLFTTLVDLSPTVATVAVDTTATKLLELTFQSGSAGSSCTFHVATIEVLNSGAAGGSAALTIVRPALTPGTPTDDFTAALSGWTAVSTAGAFDITKVFGQAVDGTRLWLPFAAQHGYIYKATTDIDQEWMVGGLIAGPRSTQDFFAGIAILDASGDGVGLIYHTSDNTMAIIAVAAGLYTGTPAAQTTSYNYGQAIGSPSQMWMRLTRVGNTWNGYGSLTGAAWELSVAATISRTIVASRKCIGLFSSTALVAHAQMTADWVHTA